jgi:hypothetical protein
MIHHHSQHNILFDNTVNFINDLFTQPSVLDTLFHCNQQLFSDSNHSKSLVSPSDPHMNSISINKMNFEALQQLISSITNEIGQSNTMLEGDNPPLDDKFNVLELEQKLKLFNQQFTTFTLNCNNNLCHDYEINENSFDGFIHLTLLHENINSFLTAIGKYHNSHSINPESCAATLDATRQHIPVQMLNNLKHHLQELIS